MTEPVQKLVTSWVTYFLILWGLAMLTVIAVAIVALWRAVLGKSSIDYILADKIGAYTKSLDTNTLKHNEVIAAMNRVAAGTDALKSELTVQNIKRRTGADSSPAGE
jgi:hypothetical protein